MTQVFLGIDIGATKSHALLADEQGRVLGFGHGGPGNYEMIGWEGLRATLQGITQAALAEAGLAADGVTAAGFGIAGYDWPGERDPHLEAIASLGLDCPCSLVNDTVIGLVAGAPEGWGVGVVAGTGCNCWGRALDGREGRVTGEGGPFAEYGGGGDLVARALQAVSLAWSRRGPATALTGALIEATGATGIEDLLEGLILGRYALGSDTAPLVFRVAAEGDEVALETIRWAGRELGNLAVGVIRQLEFEALAFDIVQIGSLWNGSPLLGATALAVVKSVAPHARLVRLAAPPVVGSVLLAMEQTGLDFRPLRAGLVETTSEQLKHPR
jgi:N-acetylglucosamine kinase-like BadF-type ATPase